MIELIGKYTSAKIFAETIEDGVIYMRNNEPYRLITELN